MTVEKGLTEEFCFERLLFRALKWIETDDR